MSPAVAGLPELRAAVDAFAAGAAGLDLAWSPDARAAAGRSLRRHGLCLLGEVHGVAENPLVIERLVADLGIAVVALEWPRGLELAVHDLAVLEAADVAWFGDGRITAGHFAVLRRIPARVVAVDEPVTSADAGARDAAMAANVEGVLRAAGGPVLFVAGNLHTRLHTHEHYRPAGAHLARDRPALCALDLHYARGRFYNCGPRTFPPAAPPPGPHLVVPEATEAVVPRRRTAPRAPA